jgi:hypothetical protein
MAKYHINTKGNPGLCKASKNCPFGDDAHHYSSQEEAQSAYELQMEQGLLQKHSKIVIKAKLMIEIQKRIDSGMRFGGIISKDRTTQITEFGTQAVAISIADRRKIPANPSVTEYVNMISDLSPNTRNYDELVSVAAKISADPDNTDKLAESVILGIEAYNVLRSRNFEDSEIVSNLRQMGNEDSHSTAGDVGITTPDGRSLDISLKAESNILNNSSQRDLGRLLGDEAFIAFNQSECEVADEKSLKIARELVLGKIRSDGALVDRYKSWIVDHTPKGAFLVQLERGRERGRVPIEAMDSIERWKAISGSQQKVLGSALSPHLTKLRTTNSDFLALETERNRAVNQGVSNMISKSSQENRRDMVGKMMSLRDTEAAYINYSNGEVHKALIPRRDEFKKRDEIRVGEPIVSKTSKGVIVPIFNEKDRTYSVIEIRTRFGDHQYNYAGIKVVTEYKETIKGVQEYLKDSTQFEGYQFSKPTENVFTKLT